MTTQMLNCSFLRINWPITKSWSRKGSKKNRNGVRKWKIKVSVTTLPLRICLNTVWLAITAACWNSQELADAGQVPTLVKIAIVSLHRIIKSVGQMWTVILIKRVTIGKWPQLDPVKDRNDVASLKMIPLHIRLTNSCPQSHLTS